MKAILFPRFFVSLRNIKNSLRDREKSKAVCFFLTKRIRGKKGRGAGRKIPVFELLKRNGRVYVEIVKNCSREHLMPIIKGKVLEGSTIYSDGWKSYDGLILNAYKIL